MSNAAQPVAYQPTDRMYLWLLTQPAMPVLIGELNMVRTLRGVSLRYTDAWIERGFALSEDLPLLRQEEFLPTGACRRRRRGPCFRGGG